MKCGRCGTELPDDLTPEQMADHVIKDCTPDANVHGNASKRKAKDN